MESKEEIKLNDHEVQYLCLALTERIRFYKTLILRARRQAQTAKDEEQIKVYLSFLRGYERTYATLQKANYGASLNLQIPSPLIIFPSLNSNC